MMYRPMFIARYVAKIERGKEGVIEWVMAVHHKYNRCM